MDKAYVDVVVDAALREIDEMIAQAERDELEAHIKVTVLRRAIGLARQAAAHEAERLKVGR